MNLIGEKIKALRKEKNMTQETLAKLLSVSYQSVSKWETGVTSPDLSLIVPLARLFQISTDELLGMTQYETNERRAHFDALCKDAWKYEADFELLAAAREAVAAFPEDMRYREWLCSSLYYCAFQNPDTMTEMLDECVEQGLVVWEQDKTDLRYDALWTIVMAYAYSDRKEQAEQFALLFPETSRKYANRDRALTLCLTGEELLRHKQKLFSGALYDFVDACREFSDFGDRREPRTRQAVAVEKAVYDALYPDGRTLRGSLAISAVHWKLAEFALVDGDYDKAVAELAHSRQYRVEADRAFAAVGERYTAPLLDAIVHDTPGESWPKSRLEYWLDDLRENKAFEPLRERPDFQALIR